MRSGVKVEQEHRCGDRSPQHLAMGSPIERLQKSLILLKLSMSMKAYANTPPLERAHMADPTS